MTGLIIAALWVWWSSSKEEADADPDDQPGVPDAAPVSQSDAAEAIRVLRDLADGSLIVEISGRQYRSLDAISDPQTRRRFIGNVIALARFARLDDVSEPLPEPIPAPEDVSGHPEPAEVTDALPAPSAKDEPDAPIAPPPPVVGSAAYSQIGAPSERPKRRGLFGRRAATSDEDVSPVLAMAEQIEAILQYRLTLSAEYVERSIHVRSTASGGVEIEGNAHLPGQVVGGPHGQDAERADRGFLVGGGQRHAVHHIAHTAVSPGHDDGREAGSGGFLG